METPLARAEPTLSACPRTGGRMTIPPMPTRQEIEDFLYTEAALLDEWRLQEWLALLTADATYYVPSTDAPDGAQKTTLFLVADDAVRIRSQGRQLLGKGTHAETPRSLPPDERLKSLLQLKLESGGGTFA